MFYSHEILTSRKHGVATIWLVATLGSKSSLKKVSRKAILDVDVSKACETICDPESPMALRLQSSLLYGVSRVFSQQCGYIWTDIQSLHDKMRNSSLVLRDLQIDSGVAQTSSDQLNLPADPGFNFDLNMAIDFSLFGITSEESDASSLLSPHSFASTQSSLLPVEGSEHELDLSFTGTPENDFLNFDLNPGMASSSVHRPAAFADSALDEPGIDEDPPFLINEYGVIIDGPSARAASGSIDGINPFLNIDDDPDIAARVADEHAALADIQGIAEMYDDDDGVVLMGDDNDESASLSLPAMPLRASADVDAERNTRHSTPGDSGAEMEVDHVIADAPQRRLRVARPPQIDNVTILSNRHMNEWQDDYPDNMARAKLERDNRRSGPQARRNAAFWVLDQGIGGAAINFGDDREQHPLAVFCGQSLLDALTGVRSISAGVKRSHSLIDDESEDEEENARRVRRSTEENIGRADDQQVQGDMDDGMLFQGDDDVESQVGRNLASSLKDQPSSMPWNIMGSSRQGSIRASTKPGRSSSIQGIGIDIGQQSIASRHRPRLTSASPLLGRGRPSSRLASLDPQDGNSSLGLDEFTDPYADLVGAANEAFELYGPAGVVSTQQAEQSQWLNTTLENEAHNFLMFLNEQLGTDDQQEGGEPTITFERLLPPETNSNIVAAQGILHVLALATKGLINVHQQEAFKDISLSIRMQHDEHANDEAATEGENEDEDNIEDIEDL